MNVDDITGRDIAGVAAATLDAALDAYPVLVIPSTDDELNEFNTRVLSVTQDERQIITGTATVDLELTDKEGVGRVFRLTITATELRSL